MSKHAKKKQRKNEYELFGDRVLSRTEKMRISESLEEITSLAIEGSGVTALPASYFKNLLERFGTRLVGVVFDLSEGGTYLGPYVGSIAAFDTPRHVLLNMGLIDFFFRSARQPQKIRPFKEAIMRFSESRRFLTISERSRMLSDYAKQEMAKLNAEFYGYLRQNSFLLLSVCRESTSYKTYKAMEASGSFRFILDERLAHGYMGSHEPFHLIFGEFLQ